MQPRLLRLRIRLRWNRHVLRATRGLSQYDPRRPGDRSSSPRSRYLGLPEGCRAGLLAAAQAEGLFHGKLRSECLNSHDSVALTTHGRKWRISVEMTRPDPIARSAQGADIAVEWLIGAPAGLSLTPGDSSTGCLVLESASILMTWANSVLDKFGGKVERPFCFARNGRPFMEFT